MPIGGQPVANAAVALWAVDEAVLSLLGTETPKLLDEMYPNRIYRDARFGRASHAPAAGRDHAPGRGPRHRGRGGEPTVPQSGGYGHGTGGLSGRTRVTRRVIRLESLAIEGRDVPPVIELRTRFATTPLFAGLLTTGADGVARTTLELPDNLTRYRLIALAANAGDCFGSADAAVTVRKPLLLQPALPRFVYPGDRFEASVTVHNETGHDADVTIMARCAGARIDGSDRRTVRLGAGEKRELLFPMLPERPGTLRVQFGAVAEAPGAPRETDAVELAVPVLVPASTEAFATYGVTEETFAQPLQPPEGVLDWGGLDVELSSTALVGLHDAADSILEYPWECLEQTASRLRVLAALRDIGPDFGLRGLTSRDAIDASAAAAIRRLAALQDGNGGFRAWPEAYRTFLFDGAYAVQALLEAKRAGFPVADQMLERGLGFVRGRLASPVRDFGEDQDLVAQALGVLVLSQAGRPAPPNLERLYDRRADLPLYAQAWLLQAAHHVSPTDRRAIELRRVLENAAVETPAGVHFAEDHAEGLRMIHHSARETDAAALDALVRIDPQHPLLPKIARSLMQARVAGHWGSTYADAAVLVAIRATYDATEGAPPSFRASVWVGAQTTGQTTFEGRTLRVVEQHIPIAALRASGPRDVVLGVQGQGRLYYRLGLRTIPEGTELPPEEQGFAVARAYEAIDDPADVRVDADGTSRIRAGAVVRVRVTVVVPDDRFHVVLDDPLPAGLEAVNLRLSTSARETYGGAVERRVSDAAFWTHWYALFAFDHLEMRDERVAAFADSLPAGVYEYTYLARATTPGRFLVPPARAEEMYAPELFGRSATAHVRIE